MHSASALPSRGRLAKAFLASCLALAGMTIGNAQLLFTQYYEGASNNKFIEITNIGEASIDLTSYSLSLFSNANRDAWKTNGTANTVATLSGSLAAHSTLVLKHTSAALPAGPTAAATVSSAVNFNGDDSLVLWNDLAAFSTARITDVISFTASDGADKSFVRTSSNVGYSLGATSILSFPLVWTSIDLATANAAVVGTENYLGYSSIAAASAIPEPSTYAAIFGGLALVGTVVYRRRQAKA